MIVYTSRILCSWFTSDLWVCLVWSITNTKMTVLLFHRGMWRCEYVCYPPSPGTPRVCLRPTKPWNFSSMFVTHKTGTLRVCLRPTKPGTPRVCLWPTKHETPRVWLWPIKPGTPRVCFRSLPSPWISNYIINSKITFRGTWDNDLHQECEKTNTRFTNIG